MPGSPLASATLELKHERSFRHLKAFAAVDSPTKKGKHRGVMLGERPHDAGSPVTPHGSPPSSPRHPRRPKSMQVPAGAPPPAPRHASYGARSISRATSHTSIEDANRESQSKEKEKEGRRGFMNGVRRISLVPGKKHKRTKSTATVEDDDQPQLPSISHIPLPAMVMTPNISSQLLPPIELQPPSPPREQEPDEPRKSMASERSVVSTSGSLAAGVESLLLQPSVDIKSTLSPPTITPRPLLSKSPTSPQSASLGRATQPPPASTATGIVPRRNSLGDLKIPARISKAQVGLKRDLGMVREFAAEVESEYRNCSTLTIASVELAFRPQRAASCLPVSRGGSPNCSSRACTAPAIPGHISDVLQPASSSFPCAVTHQSESFPRARRPS
jgi:hypothetical protein